MSSLLLVIAILEDLGRRMFSMPGLILATEILLLGILAQAILFGLWSKRLPKPQGIAKFMFLPLLYIFSYLVQGANIPVLYFFQHLITSSIFLIFALVLQLGRPDNILEKKFFFVMYLSTGLVLLVLILQAISSFSSLKLLYEPVNVDMVHFHIHGGKEYLMKTSYFFSPTKLAEFGFFTVFVVGLKISSSRNVDLLDGAMVVLGSLFIFASNKRVYIICLLFVLFILLYIYCVSISAKLVNNSIFFLIAGLTMMLIIVFFWNQLDGYFSLIWNAVSGGLVDRFFDPSQLFGKDLILILERLSLFGHGVGASFAQRESLQWISFESGLFRDLHELGLIGVFLKGVMWLGCIYVTLSKYCLFDRSSGSQTALWVLVFFITVFVRYLNSHSFLLVDLMNLSLGLVIAFPFVKLRMLRSFNGV